MAIESYPLIQYPGGEYHPIENTFGNVPLPANPVYVQRNADGSVRPIPGQRITSKRGRRSQQIIHRIRAIWERPGEHVRDELYRLEHAWELLQKIE